MNETDFHLKEAKISNNKTWSILDKKEVTAADQDEAIRLVNTSCHHWLIVGEPVNFQRSEYMLAKVYNKFGMHSLAHPLVRRAGEAPARARPRSRRQAPHRGVCPSRTARR